MICPSCSATNQADTEECFLCGRSLFALTQGRLLAARYEIRRPIGQGGMGKVYEALDRVLGERVAVKVLRPQFAREPDMARRFLSEIRLARRITHPNVCRLHEYGESEGIRYLCMELVDGVNLKDVLRARRLGVEDAYDVALAASEGLGAVHAQGVIHRDFKTANIMVDRRGQVKVMDFGIAKEVGSETTGVSLAGHVLGTPEYMSPEHAQGGPIDFRSDVYALGCVIFEVFAGRALFQGTSPIDTLRRHLHEPIAFASDAGPLVPEPLVPVLTRALAKKADDRYPSVADLIEDLRAARADSALYAVLGDDVEPLAGLASLLAPAAPPEPPPTEPPPPAATEARNERAEGTRALPPDQRPSGPRPSAPPPPPAPPAGARPAARSGIAPRVAAFGSAAVVASVLALVWWRSPDAPAPEVLPASTAARPTPAASTPPMTAAVPSPSAAATTKEPLPTPPPLAERDRRPSAAVAARVLPPPATIVSAPTPAPSPVQVASVLPSPPATAVPEPAEEFGVLSLLVVPPSEVSIDGTSWGVVSSREIRLPPGAHALRVDHPDFHPYNRKFTVLAGATREVVLDLAEKGVRKAR